MIRCQVTIAGVPCDARAAASWCGACVHEHVTTDVLICEAHEERLTRPWLCVPCKEGSAPHECWVTLTQSAQVAP